MTAGFLLVVVAVVVTPGADFVVTLRNALAHGGRAGVATALGVGLASMLLRPLVRRITDALCGLALIGLAARVSLSRL